MTFKNAVIIVAAGRGTRASSNNNNSPKQYQPINDKSLLQHTIDKFEANPNIHWILPVIHKDDRLLFEQSVSKSDKLLEPAIGGATRQESCCNGLLALMDLNPEKVLIHDAARPFLSQNIIDSVLSASKSETCALPAAAILDTIKKVTSNGSRKIVETTLDRSELFSAQTPQGFIYSDILKAHEKARGENISDLTDDAAVGEWAGMQVEIIESDKSNTKITTYDDLINAKTLMADSNNMKIPDIRCGTGYDVHRLTHGDGVILCGIKISSDKKLDGHSDADVAMHAITDALLGTIASGDIGSHFPPSDPTWKGASSDKFLKHACTLVREKMGVITHMDVSIICEYPKVGPHREAMRKCLSEITGVAVERISVKATTNEEIGSIGRGEGIAAIATATAVFDT